MQSTELSKQDQTTTEDGSTRLKESLKNILKMKITKSDDQDDQDLYDFYEWIWQKAERLGFRVTKGG